MDITGPQIRFFESLPNLITEAFGEAIQQFGFVIKDFIVNKQLFQKGEDGNKQSLGGYKRVTIRYKISKGQPADRVTLHDEEDFVASIQVDAVSQGLEITSNVPYDKFLVRKYGKAILKPNQDNLKDFFRVYVMPKLRDNVSKYSK